MTNPMTPSTNPARDEAVLDHERIPTWPPLKHALWMIVTGEKLNDGHYINAYQLTDKLYEAALSAAPAPASGVDAAKVRAAIRETEYKYFGDYEFSEGQHDAVETLVEVAKLYLASGAAAETKGPYEARICKGMPADCCDYGVVSLSEGREVCRVWREQDARAIAASLSPAATSGSEAGGERETVWCESCGEAPVSVRLDVAGLCAACAKEQGE